MAYHRASYSLLFCLLHFSFSAPYSQENLEKIVDNYLHRFPNYELDSYEDFNTDFWPNLDLSILEKFTIDQLDFLKEVGYEGPIDPEAYMTIEEIIRYHGYPVEVYEVTTPDGYILTIQRIPHGTAGPTASPRKPVLVQHGLLCSAATWVINTKDKNLPYILADVGYDVWLGNIRGTLFGRNNTHLNPDKHKFWNFSYDEMGKFDLPTVIDFMLNTTGFQQILYVGHSQGTTMAFALLSTQPKYNKIIRTFFALAPVVTTSNMKSPIRYLAPFSKEEAFILELLGTGEFLPNSKIIKFLSSTMCNSPIRILCSSILFLVCGFDLPQFNQTRLPVYLHHVPAATSVQNLVHFAQSIESGNFQYQDFGEKKNEIKYGQKVPPVYNISRITTPIEIYTSDNDYLSDPKDVEIWIKNVTNLVFKYHVPYPKFSHLDFMWAIDVKKLLYNELVDRMLKSWQD